MTKVATEHESHGPVLDCLGVAVEEPPKRGKSPGVVQPHVGKDYEGYLGVRKDGRCIFLLRLIGVLPKRAVERDLPLLSGTSRPYRGSPHVREAPCTTGSGERAEYI